MTTGSQQSGLMSAAVERCEAQRKERKRDRERGKKEEENMREEEEEEEEKDPLTLKDTGPNCLRLKISAQGSKASLVPAVAKEENWCADSQIVLMVV